MNGALINEVRLFSADMGIVIGWVEKWTVWAEFVKYVFGAPAKYLN